MENALQLGSVLIINVVHKNSLRFSTNG